MRVAKIENGVVVSMMEIHSPIADYPSCVEAGADVVTGFLYGGVKFTPHATHAVELAAAALELVYNKRRLAYPPIGDQLDALWKGGQDAADMLVLVQAVKAAHPK